MAAKSAFDTRTAADRQKKLPRPKVATSGTADRNSLPGKPVGAIVAAAKIIRALHGSARPLTASEVARETGIHRGSAYNLLRTLQAEGYVAYDEVSRSYSISLGLLELAHGALRKSGLLDLARPIMQKLSEDHLVTLYLAQLKSDRSLLLLDWAGPSFRTDGYVTTSGATVAAFSGMERAEIAERFAKVQWYRKPELTEFLTRVDAAKAEGFAVDRGAMFKGLTQVSAPILSASGELVLVINAVGYSHDIDDVRLTSLCRGVIAAAGRIGEGLQLLRLS